MLRKLKSAEAGFLKHFKHAQLFINFIFYSDVKNLKLREFKRLRQYFPNCGPPGGP